MTKEVSGFVTIKTLQGELIAHVMKTHLESAGIPVLLQYESVSQVYGILIDGLGEVHILVPQALAEEAKQILKEESSPETA